MQFAFINIDNQSINNIIDYILIIILINFYLFNNLKYYIL